MNEQELALLAADWVFYWHAPEGSAAKELLFTACEREWELVEKNPEEAWQFILLTLKLDGSPRIQEVLSAGPLEDLLSKHGEAMIGSVENEARSNPSFASLLGGVWQNAMSESVWSRVQAVWNRSGWDGLP